MLKKVCLKFFPHPPSPPQVEEAEVLVADTAGESIDNKTRIDVIRQQEELIKEEAEEKEKEVRRRLSACLYGCLCMLSCLTIAFSPLSRCYALFLPRKQSWRQQRQQMWPEQQQRR